MPPPPPVAYATLSSPLPSAPYILSITPSPSAHLILRHPSPTLTLSDPQTLQPIETFRDGHSGHVTDVTVDQDAIWSSARDASVVRWDERSRSAAMSIKAFVRKPLPVLAVAASEGDHLVIGGTELVSSEAHILFWDTRNTKTPAYSHTATHSDDITHLSLLPPTSSWAAHSTSPVPLPERLLLSTSTDGLVALSDLRETDEEEAVLAAENWGQSVAGAGWFGHKGAMKVWARSDMDGVATWDIGRGAEDQLELGIFKEFPSEEFKFKDFPLPSAGPSTVRTAAEEHAAKEQHVKSDYLIDVVPSLGVSSHGVPITAIGTNAGDIILQHHSHTGFHPSAFFLSDPTARGHKDVIRSLYHDRTNLALYTGSEDGVLSGWSLASLQLRVGDHTLDDDGGDGREDIRSDEEEEQEESEIETEDESEGEDQDETMDLDEAEGRRYGPILGGKTHGAEARKERRKEARSQPY
ncbi:hypothetical protein EHS25_000117 [Saitozyma podzolica]|uniref:Uncharacterized protein n=1 Tax=Saitozyma podzolica TaxID=1890683 RepID=A0A427YVK0_9TREE|nr:hypothetical protein EHS25_000117 [Saitozyma podzolica]